MFATQVLPEGKSESDARDEIVSEIVGVIIVDDKKYEVRRGETIIGRDSSLCSIVLNNYTVSKVHAAIESEGVDDTFIYDVNSTNQTKLGKKVLRPHCRYKLDHKSKLTFGNVIAEFLFPPVFNNTNLENLNPLDKVEDIFNVATQVCIPDSSVSSGPVFKNFGAKSHTFKVPNLLAAKVKESEKNEVTYCKSDSSKTEFQVLENSNIFNLNTQCQLYEPSAADVKSEVKTVPSDDNHNSCLNNGQDDVLCNFINLNFPKAQDKFLKKIINKTETENSSQVLNISTQTKKLGEKSELKQEEQVIKESSSSCKPSISLTTLSCKFMQNQPKNKNSTCILEENDLIKTQEFNFDATKNIRQQNTQSKDPESQSHFKDTLNNFFKEQTNEDLILIQTYENFEKSYHNFSELSREQINEDLILTQVYENFEKSYQGKAVHDVIPETKEFIKTSEDIFTNIEAHLKKDSKFNFEESLDLIQRNNQDDFIATQVFEADVKNEKILNSSDDDEDFIDSQPVEMSVNKTQSSKNSLKSFFRESSPDLLSSEGTHRNFEDYIFTQTYEVPECQDQTFFLKIKSAFSSRFNKQNECIFKEPIVLESSDDETESDLEIITEEHETNKANKSFKTEFLFKNNVQSENLPTQEDDNSYIFEFGPGNHSQQIKTTIEQKRPTYLSDSDATDCEEIDSFSPKISIKQERLKKIEFEETQTLTSTLSHNFAKNNSGSKDDWMSGKGSPMLKINNVLWSPLSLEMSCTQDVESSLNKNLGNEHDKRKDLQTPSKIQKTEVGTKNSNEVIFSKLAPADPPLKRPLDSNRIEVVPFKKLKTEGLLQNTKAVFEVSSNS